MASAAERLDVALVSRGLVRSRTQARALIDAGLVQVNGAVATRASVSLRASDRVAVETDPYVSRAAHKLLGALTDLALDVSGRALDAGASTGGFTQVLLERGCAPVYAVDVGHGQLAPLVRDDPRVVVHEQGVPAGQAQLQVTCFLLGEQDFLVGLLGAAGGRGLALLLR